MLTVLVFWVRVVVPHLPSFIQESQIVPLKWQLLSWPFEQILGSAAPSFPITLANGARSTSFCSARGHTPIAKNLALYRIGKRPLKQNRAKVHQKYRKSYVFSILYFVFSAYLEGCCVFLPCRGSSLSQHTDSSERLHSGNMLDACRFESDSGTLSGIRPLAVMSRPRVSPEANSE